MPMTGLKVSRRRATAAQTAYSPKQLLRSSACRHAGLIIARNTALVGASERTTLLARHTEASAQISKAYVRRDAAHCQRRQDIGCSLWLSGCGRWPLVSSAIQIIGQAPCRCSRSEVHEGNPPQHARYAFGIPLGRSWREQEVQSTLRCHQKID